MAKVAGKNTWYLPDSRQWHKKVDDVISMVQDYNPDVAAISEANMRAEVDQHMNFIPGYNISTVKDFMEEGVSRLVVLTREGLNFKLLSEKMEAGIASIWLSFVRKGKKPFIVGAIYREHKILMGRNAGQNLGQAQVGQIIAQNMGQVRMGQNLGQAHVGQTWDMGMWGKTRDMGMWDRTWDRHRWDRTWVRIWDRTWDRFEWDRTWDKHMWDKTWDMGMWDKTWDMGMWDRTWDRYRWDRIWVRIWDRTWDRP